MGEEPGKGTDTVKEAHRTLQALGDRGLLRFVGNVEGRDILRHGADVCVCDGFVGNVVLKLAECVATDPAPDGPAEIEPPAAQP